MSLRRRSSPVGAASFEEPVRTLGAWTRRGGGGVRGFLATGRKCSSVVSDGLELVRPEEARTRVEGGDGLRRWRRSQDRPAVAAGAEPRIEQRDDPGVGVAADQAAEALAELEHRGGQRVVAEPVA